MRKSIFTIAVVGVVAFAAVLGFGSNPTASVSFLQSYENEVEFVNYLAEYKKSYGTKEEYLFRKDQFYKNLAEYTEINSRNDVTYTVGVNKFADWTPEEYNRLLGFRPTSQRVQEEYL